MAMELIMKTQRHARQGRARKAASHLRSPSESCESRFRQLRRGEGFSLIEGAIAGVILLAISLSILPLFTRSMINNRSGIEFTQIANASKARVEELFQLPFDSPQLAINAGTERVFEEYFSQRDEIWAPGIESDATADGDLALLRRTTTIRQFNVNDLNTPLDNSAPPGSVQIREITVQAQSTRTGSPLGPGKRTVVRVFKSQ